MSSHKLGICIPYRNRKGHLDKLIPHLSKHLDTQGIEHTFYVGHQIDDKLFNRGSMKNIAAKYAFDDGCDYIAWHDVDMLAEEGADYSYPTNTPIHIATQLSKYAYSMGYEQYFGGVVLFNKEQVEKTNGYSNDYWDWGQEDDDLFWRCKYENYTEKTVFQQINSKDIGVFNGQSSYVKIPIDRMVSTCLSDDHTISMLIYTEQQPDKVPIWLVGDKERRFIEYPILRKEKGWGWGISFNNSRTYNFLHFDVDHNPMYNWVKRSENQWTKFTMSYKEDTDELYLYMNDQMVSTNGDIIRKKPIILPNKLKRQTPVGDLVLGFCPQTGNYLKGKIGSIEIYNESFTSYDQMVNAQPILQYNFDDINLNTHRDVEFNKEDITIVKNDLPHRRDGRFYCLPHLDEGFVNGKWFKGETTAKNERRFVTKMQQKEIDYKNEGFNNIMEVLDVVDIDEGLYPKTKFINVKMR